MLLSWNDTLGDGKVSQVPFAILKESRGTMRLEVKALPVHCYGVVRVDIHFAYKL